MSDGSSDSNSPIPSPSQGETKSLAPESSIPTPVTHIENKYKPGLNLYQDRTRALVRTKNPHPQSRDEDSPQSSRSPSQIDNNLDTADLGSRSVYSTATLPYQTTYHGSNSENLQSASNLRGSQVESYGDPDSVHSGASLLTIVTNHDFQPDPDSFEAATPASNGSESTRSSLSTSRSSHNSVSYISLSGEGEPSPFRPQPSPTRLLPPPCEIPEQIVTTSSFGSPPARKPQPLNLSSDSFKNAAIVVVQDSPSPHGPDQVSYARDKSTLLPVNDKSTQLPSKQPAKSQRHMLGFDYTDSPRPSSPKEQVPTSSSEAPTNPKSLRWVEVVSTSNGKLTALSDSNSSFSSSIPKIKNLQPQKLESKAKPDYWTKFVSILCCCNGSDKVR